MALSPQSQALYQILLNAGSPLSIKQIASKLYIFPSTAYRLTEPLLLMGLITKTTTYPHQFMAKPIDEGLSLFLLHQTNWFTKEFSSSKKEVTSVTQSQHMNKFLASPIEFSFIQSRDELMNQSAEEINKATKSVDLLRSGNELSADVMLAIINAKKHNVLTRMLIQDYSVDNAEQVLHWQKNGILVRKTTLRHIRLMLYDCSTIYFMSYKHTDSEKDLGMKINYPPFAVILSQLFETWWQKADII